MIKCLGLSHSKASQPRCPKRSFHYILKPRFFIWLSPFSIIRWDWPIRVMVLLIQLFGLLLVPHWLLPLLLELAPQNRHSAWSDPPFLGRCRALAPQNRHSAWSDPPFLGRCWALAPLAHRSNLTLRVRINQVFGFGGQRLQYLSFGQDLNGTIEVGLWN